MSTIVKLINRVNVIANKIQFYLFICSVFVELNKRNI